MLVGIRLGCRLFSTGFTKRVSSVSYVSINKQLLNFCSRFGVVSTLPGKGLKDVFVISDVSACNVTHCRGQNVARELPGDRPALQGIPRKCI